MSILIIGIVLSLLLCPIVSAAAPVAQYTGIPINRASPLTVTSTDISTGIPPGWSWFFREEPYYPSWTRITRNAEWMARRAHRSVIMNDGSILIMGGNIGEEVYVNDVWRSTDYGATWTEINASAGWSARKFFGCTVMPDGSVMVVGGANSNSMMNDTWRSTDNGYTWTRMTASAEWSARDSQQVVALPDNSLVQIGGEGTFPDTANNQTWHSTDYGAHWTQINASSGYQGRVVHTAVTMPDGSIVVMGGETGGTTYLNDVWRSTDKGYTWNLLTANAEWSARQSHSVVVMPDRSIVLMGGIDSTHTYLNDVWRSTDYGAHWTQGNSNAGWAKRSASTSVAMPDGSIVLMGGYDGSNWKNDTWRFMPAGSSAPYLFSLVPH